MGSAAVCTSKCIEQDQHFDLAIMKGSVNQLYDRSYKADGANYDSQGVRI